MTRPLLLAAGLLFAGCHSSAPARIPTPMVAAPAPRPHHPPRADFTPPGQAPLAEFVSTRAPCTTPVADPQPAIPRGPIRGNVLFLLRGDDRCAHPVRGAY
jgi:hypothetical protein